MTALAAVAALTAVAVTTAVCAFAALRWQARAHDRAEQAWVTERRELVATVSHLADRPLPERGWDRDREPRRPLTAPRPIADPEQLPKF